MGPKRANVYCSCSADFWEDPQFWEKALNGLPSDSNEDKPTT